MTYDLDYFRCGNCGNLHETCFCGDCIERELDSVGSIQDDRDALLEKSLEYMYKDD